MANKDAPRSVPPMTECPPNAARSRELAAEQHQIKGEHGPELVGLRNDGEPIETPEEEPGMIGSPAESWPSGLSLSAGVPYIATGRVDGPLGEDSASKLLAPILMRQIGWLDSVGRIWGPGEITGEMLGGATLTPLLVQVSHD